jgi:CelD/BcsL family acetyltransferase involved in cellulose biosynthesis/GNAT superfamily N-acetyltransferase
MVRLEEVNSGSPGTAQMNWVGREDDPFIAVLRDGKEVLDLFGHRDLQSKLRRLHERCPWATRFQSWEFLMIWYQCYSTKFDPIIIYQADDDHLTGFFALARDKQDLRIVPAGDHQAEYQCWLAEPECSDGFLQAALKLLRQRYMLNRLTLKYLPAQAPTEWARAILDCGARARLRPHSRPILGLQDPKHIDKALKKKSNKSRLNRLKQRGDVRLRCLTSSADLKEVIDRISDYYDLRQGAMNSVCPFREDSNKKQFYLDLMNCKGLLHASVLTVGDEIAAAHLGIQDGDTVAVGVYSYAPSLARHSPGKFLMLMLASELASQGIQNIDLTPGGAWKDRFATKHDEVLEVTIFFRAADSRREQAAEVALAVARASLAMVGLSPMDARRLVRTLRRVSPSKLFKRAKTILWEDREFRIYYYDAASARRLEPVAGFARDRIHDLLCFEPSESWQSRQGFLAKCESRLASGNHVYTRVEDGRLVHFGWLVDDQSQSFFPEVEQLFTYPENTAALYDYYTVPQARGRGLYQQCIRTMLRDAATGSAKRVAISVLADNVASRHVIEKLGFRYYESLFLARHLGSVRRWRKRPNRPAEP